jgi:ankyrin repeat protein
MSDKTINGDTALHLAAQAFMAMKNRETADHFKCYCRRRDEAEAAEGHEDHSQSDCIELLLERGADLADKNELGLTALAVAEGAGYEDIVKVIKNHVASKNLT